MSSTCSGALHPVLQHTQAFVCVFLSADLRHPLIAILKLLPEFKVWYMRFMERQAGTMSLPQSLPSRPTELGQPLQVLILLLPGQAPPHGAEHQAGRLESCFQGATPAPLLPKC